MANCLTDKSTVLRNQKLRLDPNHINEFHCLTHLKFRHRNILNAYYTLVTVRGTGNTEISNTIKAVGFMEGYSGPPLTQNLLQMDAVDHSKAE